MQSKKDRKQVRELSECHKKKKKRKQRSPAKVAVTTNYTVVSQISKRRRNVGGDSFSMPRADNSQHSILGQL